MKRLAPLYLGFVVVLLLLVHSESYRPAVSYVLLYLTVSVIVTAAVALLLLPAQQFSEGFCAASYVFFAIFSAAAAFFTGGVSSELYVLFFPLVFASALHGSWPIGLTSQGAVLMSYFLAMLPDAVEGADGLSVIFFRLAAFAFTGVFALAVVRHIAGDEGGYALDEDGSVLLERVSGELEARRGAQVGLILVDPGRQVEDVDLPTGRREEVGEVAHPLQVVQQYVRAVVHDGAGVTLEPEDRSIPGTGAPRLVQALLAG